MEELKKIVRIIGRQLRRRAARGAAGDRCHHRPERHQPGARLSARRSSLTGIVLTKLDGTAKGGVVFAIRAELGVPIR